MSQDVEKLREKIRAQHATLRDARTHYDALGLRPDASADEINHAARALVREFHADRFASVDLGEAKPLLDAVFSRIQEARRALGDADARAAYDASLTSGQAPGAADEELSVEELTAIFEADEAFRRGKTLLERGQYAAAVERFEVALRANTDDPETRICTAYARFLAAPAAPGGARDARAMQHLSELEALVKAHPERTGARFFLGKLYQLLNRTSDARAAFNAVLDAEPDHVGANREIRLIQMRKDEDNPQASGGLLAKLKGLFKR